MVKERAIGFLHTSVVHVATFDRLLGEATSGVEAHHVVAEDLLELARRGEIDSVVDGMRDTLVDMADRGDAVIVCTCSTIGPLAETIDVGGRTPVLRVDQPMARRAVELAAATGGRVAVIAALESTVAPTRDLILDEARAASSELVVDVEVVAGAWALFEAGDNEGYWREIASATREVALTADVVVLAQASMAGALAQLTDVSVPVLVSPPLAVAEALRVLGEVSRAQPVTSGAGSH